LWEEKKEEEESKPKELHQACKKISILSSLFLQLSYFELELKPNCIFYERGCWIENHIIQVIKAGKIDGKFTIYLKNSF